MGVWKYITISGDDIFPWARAAQGNLSSSVVKMTRTGSGTKFLDTGCLLMLQLFKHAELYFIWPRS